MPGYTYSTFGELKTTLATLLSDPSKSFWVDAELGGYLNQALRELNAMARMFRDRGVFPTTSSAYFYDLTSVLKNGDNFAFLAPVVTDAQLLTQAKYLLMEPSPDNNTTFSDGFSLDDFNDAFERRRNQFLLETGLIISQTSENVPSGEGRVQFTNDAIIDVRRATWTTLDGAITTLFREDEFTSSTFTPAWPQNSGAPRRYSIYPDPLLTIQLIPPPVDNGTLTLQTISSGSILDDFTPFILWGALSDVLSNTGPNTDTMRAQYCEQRYSEGVIIASQVATAQLAYINGVTAQTTSVFDYDTFTPSWMTRGTPKGLGMLGANLVAVSPAANDVYSVTIDAVRNAPQFTNDADPVPIGREYINLLVDYAAHLAAFKQGGTEFQSTFPAYNTFVKAAVGYNNRMSAQNLNFETLVDKALKQEQQVPLRKEEVA